MDFGKTEKQEEWLTIPYKAEVNAFYDPEKNGMIIPVQSLGGWMFDADRPVPLNIATLSLFAHHEITHGFDSQGSKYDFKG